MNIRQVCRRFRDMVSTQLKHSRNAVTTRFA
ncbi:MAG: hypothetical protein IIY20_05070 [Bifidobacteriaceae bacterium]|nr:hypothetical protein [Bifidobacteriaceae bacterium]